MVELAEGFNREEFDRVQKPSKKTPVSFYFLKNMLPKSFFKILGKDELIDLVEIIGEDGFKGLPKNRVGWYWQQQALFNFFDAQKFCACHFEPSYVKIPTDEIANISVQTIENFNKEYKLTEKTTLYSPFDEHTIKSAKTNKYIRANLEISNTILKEIHFLLKEYNSAYEYCPDDYSNSWSHFYSLYRDAIWDKLKEVFCKFVFIDSKEERNLFLSEHVFLNFLKILTFFSGSLNIPVTMHKEDFTNFRVCPLATFGKSIRGIYHNASALTACIEKSLGNVEPNRSIQEKAKPKKNSIPKSENQNLLEKPKSLAEIAGDYLKNIEKERKKETLESFKADYMKYYNKEMSRRELCKKYDIADSTIKVWRDRLSLPIINYKGRCKKHDLLKVPEKSTNCSIESPVSEVPAKLVSKAPFTVKFFGYEISLGVKKVEPPKPVDMSDELKDFIEY